MAEQDKLVNLTIGLKPWARDEVRRQAPKTLEEAFAMVDKLIEHSDGGSERGKKKLFGKKVDAPKKDAPKSNNAEAKSNTKKPLKCWIFTEEHMVKNFP